MSNLIPNFFKLEQEVEGAKDYVLKCIEDHKPVQPVLTFYHQERAIFSVTLPVVETAEQRQIDFARAAWLNGCVRANGIRFVADSMVPLKNALDEDYNQDLILIFFANKMGCFVNPKCYVISGDTNTVEWVDREIDEKLIMSSQPGIVNMLAAQFFFSSFTVTWVEYVEYLEEQGFVFEYHTEFTKNLVEYAQASLY